MICEATLANFDKFFCLVYKYGFGLFEWNKEKRLFLPYSFKKSKKVILVWWISMAILLFKNLFLFLEYKRLFSEGDMAEIVMHTVFFMTCGAAATHNLLLWKYRHHIPYLFNRCALFSKNAQEKYMPDLKSRYPVEDDGLGPNIKMGSMAIIVFPLSAFFLSFNSPTMSPFLGNAFPGAVTEFTVLRLLFSMFEAYIAAFAWTGNIYVVTLMPNCAHLLAFWVNQLRAEEIINKKNVNTVQVTEMAQTYRELQVLTLEFNECFGYQTLCVFSFAFVNQVSMNYGTLRLYDQLSFASWIGCPYLSISGTINLFMVQSILAAPYEESQTTTKNWQGITFENLLELRWMKRFIKSCPNLKLREGNYKHFQKDTGIEYVDSLIDRTVTLLLWQE